MNNTKVIQRTKNNVKSILIGESSGHDWWHVYRVWKTAISLADQEEANRYVVELAALLHDIGDWKLHGGDETAGHRLAREWLQKLSVEESTIDHVCEIIQDLSFKGAGVPTPMRTLEGCIVQDADRLDAMGAIGIARAFAFGGHFGREIYNPDIQPEAHQSFEAYKKGKNPTIHHFYEKLLLLKDRMNTNTAKAVAESRHRYMEQFLEQFYREWDGEDIG